MEGPQAPNFEIVLMQTGNKGLSVRTRREEMQACCFAFDVISVEELACRCSSGGTINCTRNYVGQVRSLRVFSKKRIMVLICLSRGRQYRC